MFVEFHYFREKTSNLSNLFFDHEHIDIEIYMKMEGRLAGNLYCQELVGFKGKCSK